MNEAEIKKAVEQFELIKRPFDFLGNLIGKEVLVRCKGYKEHDIEGTLLAFDANLNLVIAFEEGKKKFGRFLKGDNLIFIDSPERLRL